MNKSKKNMIIKINVNITKLLIFAETPTKINALNKNIKEIVFLYPSQFNSL